MAIWIIRCTNSVPVKNTTEAKISVTDFPLDLFIFDFMILRLQKIALESSLWFVKEIRWGIRALRVLEFPLKKLDYRHSLSLPQLLCVSTLVVLLLKDGYYELSVVGRLSQLCWTKRLQLKINFDLGSCFYKDEINSLFAVESISGELLIVVLYNIVEVLTDPGRSRVLGFFFVIVKDSIKL